MNIQINSEGFKIDQKLKEYIEKKLVKIERYYDRIGNVTLSLKLENNGQVKDKIAELSIALPGKTVIANSSAKKFENAVDQVISNAKRQVKRYKERLRAY